VLISSIFLYLIGKKKKKVLASWIRIYMSDIRIRILLSSSVADPDPLFLGHPDLLVRGMDPENVIYVASKSNKQKKL
jgi:hypothetical protein